MDRARSRRPPAPSSRAAALLASIIAAACVGPLACGPGAAADAPSRGDTATVVEVRRALERTGVELGEALRRGDAAAVAAHYTEDAVGFYPNEEAVRGREALRARLTGLLGTVRVLDARHEPEEVQVFGDVAFEAGRYTYVLQPGQAPGQAAVTDRGKYLIEWRRQPDGAWRVRRDMDNSSLPASR